MRNLTFAMVLFASAAAAQDSTPFAQQPYSAGGEIPLIGLSEVMAIAQMRHIKLWQAAKAENWPLASYEADKLRDSLYRAAGFYVNIPVPLVKSAAQPLSGIQDAAKRRDQHA